MADADIEARVLVCDPLNEIFPDMLDILGRRFGEGEHIPIHTQMMLKAGLMGGFGDFGYRGVEFEFADNLTSVVRKVKSHPAPYYSMVVYESTRVDPQGGPGMIADVRKHDFFMPQLISGKGLKMSVAAQCARAGALYFAEGGDETRGQLLKIFQKGRRLPNLTVVKVGGSAFDFDRQVKGSLNLESVCDALVSIHKDRKKGRNRIANRIILTVGAGQHGDVVKETRAKYIHNESVQDSFPKTMAQALQLNLESLKPILGESAALLNTGAFYYLTENSASRRIPLIGTAPHYIMVRDGIPLQDSDTHTIALAEYCHAERVVLIKRTDGIYDYDPYRGFPFSFGIPEKGLLGKIAGSVLRARWRRAQRKNRRHSVVTIDEMLGEGILREGTGAYGRADGTTGHLIEDSALRYMRDNCKHVKEIVVVHIAPEEMHYNIGKNRYRHVVTGEEIEVDPETGWRGVLEQNIRNAFKGIANSKIVRDAEAARRETYEAA